jgi:hypothetical protein
MRIGQAFAIAFGLAFLFVAVGAAIWFYAHALRWSLDLRHLQARWRIECLANVLAGSLCGIGTVLHGGPIGALGADWFAGLGHYLAVGAEDILEAGTRTRKAGSNSGSSLTGWPSRSRVLN